MSYPAPPAVADRSVAQQTVGRRLQVDVRVQVDGKLAFYPGALVREIDSLCRDRLHLSGARLPGNPYSSFEWTPFAGADVFGMLDTHSFTSLPGGPGNTWPESRLIRMPGLHGSKEQFDGSLQVRPAYS